MRGKYGCCRKDLFETFFGLGPLPFAFISSYFHEGLSSKGSDNRLICKLLSDFKPRLWPVVSDYSKKEKYETSGHSQLTLFLDI